MPISTSTEAKDTVVPRSHRLTRRLLLSYALCALAIVLLLPATLLPAGVAPPLRALASELIAGGAAGAALSALLLAVTPLLGTFLLTGARFRHSSIQPGTGRQVTRTGWRDLLVNPGTAARVGQALVMPVGAVIAYAVARLLWPVDSAALESSSINIVAALLFALTFVSLVCERVIAAFPAAQLPEAPALRRVLLLTTVVLAALACIELGRSAGLT
jgi:hypothetical protein